MSDESKTIPEAKQDLNTHELSSGATESTHTDESGVSGLLHKVTDKVQEVGHKLAAKDDETHIAQQEHYVNERPGGGQISMGMQ
ncbi:hypothetical protein CBOM_05388 [Ceraceosorus bombacis]|uniref:Uncharacterized protein n=1 Tax=Ceraceosorus bombacis TaxID=401625 RepID=A0A0P1BR97_9BASI|nr:hypothetical protein CBOM_05388 [Ceraceosorus bombacis]